MNRPSYLPAAQPAAVAPFSMIDRQRRVPSHYNNSNEQRKLANIGARGSAARRMIGTGESERFGNILDSARGLNSD